MANKREFKKYADALGASVVTRNGFSLIKCGRADQDKIAEHKVG